MSRISELFERYEWHAVPVEEGCWRATFAVDSEEEFDLYTVENDGWIHFAVSPLTVRPSAECRPAVYQAMARTNLRLRMARLAVDSDGDISLLIDIPEPALDYALFATAVDTLQHATGQLSPLFRQLATEPGVVSAHGDLR